MCCAAVKIFEKKFIPDEPSEGAAQFLHQVAIVMVKLYPKALCSTPRSKDDSDDWDITKPWPTPSRSEFWEEVTTIACRLFVTLEWASQKAAAAKEPLCDNDCTTLRETVLLLLSRLLLGYLQDDNLDMQKLFRYCFQQPQR